MAQPATPAGGRQFVVAPPEHLGRLRRSSQEQAASHRNSVEAKDRIKSIAAGPVGELLDRSSNSSSRSSSTGSRSDKQRESKDGALTSQDWVGESAAGPQPDASFPRETTHGSDGAGGSALNAVRNARQIQHIIQALGNEASRCHEKFVRKTGHSAAKAADVFQRAQADARKTAAKLRSKRRAAIVARLEERRAVAEMPLGVVSPDASSPSRHGSAVIPEASKTASFVRGVSGVSGASEDFKGQRSGPTGSPWRSRKSKTSTLAVAKHVADDTSDSSESDASQEYIPGLKASRARRKASKTMTSIVSPQRRGSLLRSSLGSSIFSAGDMDAPSAPGPQRKSSSCQQSPIALQRASLDLNDLDPEELCLESPTSARKNGSKGSSPRAEAVSHFEVTAAMRRRLPEVPGLRSKFKDHRLIFSGRWQVQAFTTKRHVVATAERLGLDEKDWEFNNIYNVQISDLEEAANQKQERIRNLAAAKIQSMRRCFLALRKTRKILAKRRTAAILLQRWLARQLRFRFPLVWRCRMKAKRRAAAQRIQAVVRGWIARKRYATSRELHVVFVRMKSVGIAMKDRLIEVEPAVGGCWRKWREQLRLRRHRREQEAATQEALRREEEARQAHKTGSELLLDPSAHSNSGIMHQGASKSSSATKRASTIKRPSLQQKGFSVASLGLGAAIKPDDVEVDDLLVELPSASSGKRGSRASRGSHESFKGSLPSLAEDGPSATRSRTSASGAGNRSSRSVGSVR